MYENLLRRLQFKPQFGNPNHILVVEKLGHSKELCKRYEDVITEESMERIMGEIMAKESQVKMLINKTI